jgi:hypothetical protein
MTRGKLFARAVPTLAGAIALFFMASPEAHAGAVVALQQGGYGPWSPVIGFATALLRVLGPLGVALGFLFKGYASANSAWHEHSNEIILSSMAGTLVGYLAEPLYDLIFSWM